KQQNKNILKINKKRKNIPFELLTEIFKTSINPIEILRQLTRKELNKDNLCTNCECRNSKMFGDMEIFGMYWKKVLQKMVSTSKITYKLIGKKFLKRNVRLLFIMKKLSKMENGEHLILNLAEKLVVFMKNHF
ncbi:hypothetical protein Mgra_00005598, partial [Meloidogyne graminicola]